MPTMTESILDLCTDVRAQVNLKNSSDSPSANRQSSASRYRDSLCINIRATAPLLIPHEVSEATTPLCQAEPRSNEDEEQGHSLCSSKQITAKQVRSMINNARISHNLGDSALHTVKLSLVEDFRREWPSIIRDAAQQAFEELKRYIRSYIDIHLDQYVQIKVLVENTVDPLAHKFHSTLSEQLSTLHDRDILPCRDQERPQLEVPEKRPAKLHASCLQTAGFSSDTVPEPVPLQMSTNRWVANSIVRQGQTTSGISPAMVAGKVLALLNKLSPSNFDSISDQVIVWANVSENEKDARTLHQIVTIIYDNAIDEASRSELYARLCRKMMEQISPKVMEVGVQTIDGRHVAGAHLFRKHLLDRAQEEFERGWSFAEIVMTSKLFSDEYYTAQKARRRNIGYIKFLGELFKLRMMTERIMHECVKRLIMRVEFDSSSESIEGLCTLLNTIGCFMDTSKARAHMNVYFSEMEKKTKQPELSLRLRFMLLNTIEMRERNWIPRANKLVHAAVISIPRTARMNTSQHLGNYTGRGGKTLTGFDLYRHASSGERAPGQSCDPHNARLFRRANNLNPTSAHIYKDTVPYDALPTHPDSTSQLANTEDRGDSGVKTHLFSKPSSVFQSHADSTPLNTPCPSNESAPSYCTSGSAKKEAFNELSSQHEPELPPMSTYEEELQLMADVRTCFKDSSEHVIHDVSRVIDEHMLAFVEELQTRLLSAMGLQLMVPRRTTQ